MTGHHRLVIQCHHYNGRTSYQAPSLKWTSHIVMRFHRRVWYRPLSLCYVCIQRSGIILIP